MNNTLLRMRYPFFIWFAAVIASAASSAAAEISAFRAGEELIDPGAAELERRQADAVHDNQLGQDIGRPRVEVRRQHLANAHEQARGGLNLQGGGLGGHGSARLLGFSARGGSSSVTAIMPRTGSWPRSCHNGRHEYR